jgi:Na+-transporting methylmalonyl-CoA/oxaloacetate decarboxylase gamma subunit
MSQGTAGADREVAWAARRGDLVSMAVTIGSLLPGFALPFVLALEIGHSRADLYLLAATVGLTLMNAVGNAIEANTIAEFGRLRATGRWPSKRAFRAYRRRIVRFDLLAIVAAGVPLGIVYGLSVHDRRDFAMACVLTLLVPAIGGLSSTKSAQVILLGHTPVAVLAQSFRNLLPLAGALVFEGAIEPWQLAALTVTGEVCRLGLLTAAARPAGDGLASNGDRAMTRGLVWQSFATGTAQGGPITDRIFLSGTVGGISAYEMADKIFFAGVQFINYGLLLRRTARWTGLTVVPPALARRTIRRDTAALVGVALVLAVLGIAVVLVATMSRLVPPSWVEGLSWASIVLISLPASVANAATTRVLVLARRQSQLMYTSLLFTGANALLDWLMFATFGAIGIPIATVLVRFLSAALFFVLGTRAAAALGTAAPATEPLESRPV